MKVIKRGKIETFRAVCPSCGSELEYTKKDMKGNIYSDSDDRYVICPVCDWNVWHKFSVKQEEK